MFEGALCALSLKFNVGVWWASTPGAAAHSHIGCILTNSRLLSAWSVVGKAPRGAVQGGDPVHPLWTMQRVKEVL